LAVDNHAVKRAIDILAAAAEHGMFDKSPDGGPLLPEDDGAKIIEAEKLVEMCRQAQRISSESGGTMVAKTDAINAVLAQAEVIGGTPQPTDDGETSLAEQLKADVDAKSEPAPAPAPQEQPPAEQQPTSDSGDALPGETWVDEDGVPWVIDADLDAEGYEAHPQGSDEKTTVPREHFKTKVSDAPSQPSSQDSPSSPSDASATSSETPPATPATESEEPGGKDSGSDTQPPGQQSSSSSSSSSDDVPVDDDEGDEEYATLIAGVEAGFGRAKLPLPADLVELPVMPEDLTGIGDIEARKLHSQFNACAARAHYLLGLERDKKVGCGRMRRKYMKGPMRQAREKLGKDATLHEVQMLAEEDESVATWIRREHHHADQEIKYKDLFEIYTENVVVLSRDWTMRSSEEHGS